MQKHSLSTSMLYLTSISPFSWTGLIMTATTRGAISAGLHAPRTTRILAALSEWCGKAKNGILEIGLSTIPSLVTHILEGYTRKVLRWKNSSVSQKRIKQDVWDLVNCGPHNCFAIGSVLAHNCNYKAGARKIAETIKLAGFPLTEDEAYAIHKAHWKLYQGILEFEKELKRQWTKNNGWVLNGIGRPISLDERREKDLINSVVQSTGHDIHVMYLRIVQKLLDETGIPYEWVIADFHDQSIVCVDEEHAERVKQLMGVTAYDILNGKYLRGKIPIRGVANIVRSMAEAKVEG